MKKLFASTLCIAMLLAGCANEASQVEITQTVAVEPEQTIAVATEAEPTAQATSEPVQATESEKAQIVDIGNVSIALTNDMEISESSSDNLRIKTGMWSSVNILLTEGVDMIDNEWFAEKLQAATVNQEGATSDGDDKTFYILLQPTNFEFLAMTVDGWPVHYAVGTFFDANYIYTVMFTSVSTITEDDISDFIDCISIKN